MVATALAMWLSITHLRLSSDLTDLFPNHGEATMLTRFLRAFGGGDLAVVLVRGDDIQEVEAAARDAADALRGKKTVVQVLDEAPLPRDVDPTLAWGFAGPAARARLAAALTPSGMRARLDGTREMLMAPGITDAETWLARDPLRLATIPWEEKTELAAGLSAGSGGAFVGNEGRARLVVAEARGSAFDAPAALSFVSDAEEAMTVAHRAHPSVRLDLTGGHAIAVATAAMLKRDMIVSGALSTILASCMFLATFRRMRALAAVLPPLALGTVWTTGLAAFFPTGLSAIATAFAAVVIGVGVDTGVHVYASFLEGRRSGLAPADAAHFARKMTWKPTLFAAIAAGLAFASLALSELLAVRQLGLLCGAGEVLTAVGILLVTPEIAILLERGPAPKHTVPAWVEGVRRLTSTRPRALTALIVMTMPLVVLAFVGWPSPSDTLVAIRPRALAPLIIQKEIYALFGGKEGQWLVVSADADRERAMARADAIAEALEPLTKGPHPIGFDALAPLLPSATSQRARLAERDHLNLPGLKPMLTSALVEKGFDPEACAPALEAFAHPSHDVRTFELHGPVAWLASRHVARDPGNQRDFLAVTYLRPSGDPATDTRTLEVIRAADPRAVVTGYHHLETALRDALAHDLPIVALVAIGLVILTLRAILRRALDVGLALATIGVEVAAVALVMRIFHVRWHVYDALVLPVLIGITMDESMFLLHAARRGNAIDSDDAITVSLREQGPLVASTALTTAAGFAALLACRFEGLFDLGAVGALGSVLGLVSALVVVPAGLRLAAPRPRNSP